MYNSKYTIFPLNTCYTNIYLAPTTIQLLNNDP